MNLNKIKALIETNSINELEEKEKALLHQLPIQIMKIIGFLKIELFGTLINILSINKKNETKNFIKVSNKPVKMVDSQTPNVLPIILYAFSLLFIFEMLIQEN